MPANEVKYFGLKQDSFEVDRVPTDDEIFTNANLDYIASRTREAVLYKRFLAVVGPVGAATLCSISASRAICTTVKTKSGSSDPNFSI